MTSVPDTVATYGVFAGDAADDRHDLVAGLEKAFARSARHGAGACVLMLVLDRAEELAGVRTHEIGAMAMSTVSRAADRVLRKPDILGRFEAGAIAAIALETDVDSAIAIAERIQETVQGVEIDTPDGARNFTVSIGISELNADMPNFASALKSAERALRTATASGRDRAVVGASTEVAAI